MALWRVVCVKRALVHRPTLHTHIVGVGTGDRTDWADMRWTLDQVLTAMDEGDIFYTQSETTGRIRLIAKYVCPHCQRTHIRSAESSVLDSDLDDLRSCIYDGEGHDIRSVKDGSHASSL